MKNKRTARIVIGSLLTVAVCAAVALNVDWNAFIAAAGRVNPVSLLPALLFLAAGKIVYTAKWKAVCPAFGFRALLAVFLGGAPLFLLPAGGFFSDAYRIAALHGEGDDYAAAASVLLDRLTMPLSIICVWLPIMAFTGDARYGAAIYVLLGLLAALAVAGVAAMLHPRPRAALLRFSNRHSKSAPGRKIYGGLQKASAAVESMKIGPGRILLTIGLGLLGDMLTAGAYRACGSALGIFLPPIKWIWVYALPLIATTALPTVGGLGVRDGAVIAFLSAYGVSSGTGLTLSLLYTGCAAVCALLSWLAHFALKRPATSEYRP